MTNKIYHVTAIGSAIVDLVCKVEEDFLTQNNLVKGGMFLIDEQVAKQLAQLKAEKITSGGSAANTVATIGALGTNCALIGKVGNDDFGKKFAQEITASNVKFVSASNNSSDNLSAKSFVLITPDAERTMCTYLGCAADIGKNAIDQTTVASSNILYLEGYLWDKSETIAALKFAIEVAKKSATKIALSLSDGFCVDRHREDFLELIKNDLDYLFCNEVEIRKLCNSEEISSAALQNLCQTNNKLTILVTRSQHGCLLVSNKEILITAAEKVEKVVDTTGAGDAFAAGYFHGLAQNMNNEDCCKMANLLAAQVIQKFGARI